MNQKGYTLIEILIVLFIISIVTSVGLLAIRHNDNKRIETVANELTQMMTLAEEQAMLQPMVLGLAINQESFHFAQLHKATEGEKQNTWIKLDDHELIKIRVPAEDREERKTILAEICQDCHAELVQAIGNIGVIYREKTS